MRSTLWILPLIFVTTAFGQTKDRRAELKIEGAVREISVSPEGNIWLTSAAGNTYYTPSIDSNWHQDTLFDKHVSAIYNQPHPERIAYFNSDTAIMTGYISFNQKTYSRKNGYYFTKDAGKTWELREFGGDEWIYCTFTDNTGRAWMGGSSGNLFFSENFGQAWKKLNSPYNASSRLHCIFMNTATQGISGALGNYIHVTDDNWKTYRKIETPYDQKKYARDQPGYADHRIEKILIWGNYYVVQQDGYIFYTKSDKVDWKQFPVQICDFELDRKSQTLLAITNDLEIISFTAPDKFESFCSARLAKRPLDIKVINHSLFALFGNYSVCEVNRNTIRYSTPLTTDKPIENPQIVKQGAHIKWGADGRHLYIDDDQTGWFREKILDFGIEDMMLINDSTAVLWSGYANYLYSLKDHSARPYSPEAPLQVFLNYPVRTFSIRSGSFGCFHSTSNEVTYTKGKDSAFVTGSYIPAAWFGADTNFKNKVPAAALYKSLSAINSGPSSVPTFRDFHISREDKKNYLALVDERIKNKEENIYGRNDIDKEFYYSVPDMLDTLPDSILVAVLRINENAWSTTSNWFSVRLINQNNDTLNVSRFYYVNTLAWHLPWEFEYNGLHFPCYNIEFSRFIDSCLPENFIDKDVFDNAMLIMSVADYLWNQKK